MPPELHEALGQPLPVGLPFLVAGHPDLLAVHLLDAQFEGRWAVKWKAAPGSRHYFVKVTQTDGDMLWSAPVWLAVVRWK